MEVTPELAKAILKFHATLPKISKDSVNPHFKSKYASLSTILDSIAPLLNTCGLAIVQYPHGDCELTTILLHESGASISSTVTMIPSKRDPQGIGSAITYYRRYAIGAILNLNIDDDDDGNAASEKQKQPTKQAEPKPDMGQPEPTPQMVATKFLADNAATGPQKSDWKAFCDGKELNPTDAIYEAVTIGNAKTFADLYHYYKD